MNTEIKKKNKAKIVTLGQKNKKKVDYLQCNRPINEGMVRKLKTSMEKYGVLSVITVYDNGSQYLIVDGQHRWQAANELELDIPALVIGWDAVNAMMDMNTIQRNWSMRNFVDFFSMHNNPEIKEAYTILKSKKTGPPEHDEDPSTKNRQHLTYSSLTKIYGKPTGEGFKQGKFRITDVGRGDKFVSYLDDIEPYLPYARSARFIHAYLVMAYHDSYDHKRFLKKLGQRHNISTKSSSNPTEYGSMLQSIYNYKQSSKTLVMFSRNW